MCILSHISWNKRSTYQQSPPCSQPTGQCDWNLDVLRHTSLRQGQDPDSCPGNDRWTHDHLLSTCLQHQQNGWKEKHCSVILFYPDHVTRCFPPIQSFVVTSNITSVYEKFTTGTCSSTSMIRNSTFTGCELNKFVNVLWKNLNF